MIYILLYIQSVFWLTVKNYKTPRLCLGSVGRVGFLGVKVSIYYIIYIIISRDRKFIYHYCHCINCFVIFEKYLIKKVKISCLAPSNLACLLHILII